jgi:hypothetical protein
MGDAPVGLRRIIAQSEGAGNTLRVPLARIVHCTVRAPQIA